MSSNSNDTYIEYFRLGDTSYREKVRFYEENPSFISSMYFEDRIEVDMDYVICLFEVGRYERFLSKVDAVLETIITENIFYFRNENIFNELLFKKASCYYNIGQYEKALGILKQLTKIEPKNQLAVNLYGICKRKSSNDTSQTIKAFAIASLLIVVGIMVGQILFVKPFYEQGMSFFVNLRNILLFFSFMCFLGQEIYIQVSTYHETGRFPLSFLNLLFRLDKNRNNQKTS